MEKIIYVFIAIAILFFIGCKSDPEAIENTKEEPVAISLNGEPFFNLPPSESLLQKLEERKSDYLKDTTNIESRIWYGRFLAYAGQYDEAIQLFTAGITGYPEEERFYRHRGHRYITLRQFDKAIADFEKASALIQGKEDALEPDGMPNARNIPVSTTHGNIYYHLGLAYYLSGNMENAYDAYKNCLNTAALPDNLVSSTHWLYMIARRLDKRDEAESYLIPINMEMDVIENMAYHKLCMFYKGEINEDELLQTEGDAPASDAILYGLGNWNYYNGNIEKAEEIWKEITTQKSWNSFGFIAAEADLYSLEKNN